MASGRRRKIRITSFEIILALIAILFIGAGVYLLSGAGEQRNHTEVMEQRLRELRRLKTVSQKYRSVIYVEEKNFWRGNKQVLFSMEYQVIAGVDFSKGLEIRDLPDGTIQVFLPPSEIFLSDADESTISQMFLREAAFRNPISMGDYMPQIIAQGEANRQAAVEGGILGRAEQNAQLAVKQVLKLGNFDNVVFGGHIDNAAAEDDG